MHLPQIKLLLVSSRNVFRNMPGLVRPLRRWQFEKTFFSDSQRNACVFVCLRQTLFECKLSSCFLHVENLMGSQRVSASQLEGNWVVDPWSLSDPL